MAYEEKKVKSFRNSQRQRKQSHPRRLLHQLMNEIIPPLPDDYKGSLSDPPPWRPTTPHAPPFDNVNQENQWGPVTRHPPPPSTTPPSRDTTDNNNKNNAIVDDQESDQSSIFLVPTSILISAIKVIKDWIHKLCKCCGPCGGSNGEEE